MPRYELTEARHPLEADLPILLDALLLMLLMATATWGLSLVLHDVSIVDSVWSLFFLAAVITFLQFVPEPGVRAGVVLGLVAAWAIRLAVYLTWRNWGEPEDRRYQAMREKNDPGFAFKSLYIIFALQAVLAWIIAFPLYPAVTGPWPIGMLDYLGIALVVVGIGWTFVSPPQSQMPLTSAAPLSRRARLTEYTETQWQPIREYCWV